MSYYERTTYNPLLEEGARPTGRSFITPCCTAGVDEFTLADGTLMCIGHVAGHGYSKPEYDSIDHYDGGTVVEADGTERYRPWTQAREDEFLNWYYI